MSHDQPRLQLHAYLKSLSGYRGAPLHVDLCFYVCNPKDFLRKIWGICLKMSTCFPHGEDYLCLLNILPTNRKDRKYEKR